MTILLADVTSLRGDSNASRNAVDKRTVYIVNTDSAMTNQIGASYVLSKFNDRNQIGLSYRVIASWLCFPPPLSRLFSRNHPHDRLIIEGQKCNFKKIVYCFEYCVARKSRLGTVSRHKWCQLMCDEKKIHIFKVFIFTIYVIVISSAIHR